jgi:hypothetical protein
MSRPAQASNVATVDSVGSESRIRVAIQHPLFVPSIPSSPRGDAWNLTRGLDAVDGATFLAMLRWERLNCG